MVLLLASMSKKKIGRNLDGSKLVPDEFILEVFKGALTTLVPIESRVLFSKLLQGICYTRKVFNQSFVVATEANK